jgi:hypothetical protein
MRPIVFTGMLIQAVPPSEAAATDLKPGAAANQVDVLILSLDKHFDRKAAASLGKALVSARERLAAIRSSALLRAAIEELAVQAGNPDLSMRDPLRSAA